MVQITVDEDLMLHINLAVQGLVYHVDRVFLPIDELLGYIVDRHFVDAGKRRELHASIRETRKLWAELGRDYAVTIGRMGTLFLMCKNPGCRAEMETQHRAIEGQPINCRPTKLDCPVCGSTHIYKARDL